MHTKIVNIDYYSTDDIKEMYDDNPVVIPTETVYGISASIYNPISLQNIFKVKGRPQDNPMIVHISKISMLEDIVDYIPEEYNFLIKEFWPGPLTLIFKNSNISKIITAGSEYVGIRMPSHPIALKIIDVMGPLAAPSANISGRPSPVSAQHVLDDMNGKIKFIVEGGRCDVGLESTIAMAENGRIKILRPGGITKEKINLLIPTDSYDTSEIVVPGSKYRHYAPRIPLILSKEQEIKRLIEYSKFKTIGIIKMSKEIEDISFFKENKFCGDKKLIFYNFKNMKEFQTHLFYIIRELEKITDIIIVEEMEKINEGLALMDRLEKASKGLNYYN